MVYCHCQSVPFHPLPPKNAPPHCTSAIFSLLDNFCCNISLCRLVQSSEPVLAGWHMLCRHCRLSSQCKCALYLEFLSTVPLKVHGHTQFSYDSDLIPKCPETTSWLVSQPPSCRRAQAPCGHSGHEIVVMKGETYKRTLLLKPHI